MLPQGCLCRRIPHRSGPGSIVLNLYDQARSQRGLPKLCPRTRRVLALTPSETASEPARFSYRTDPCRRHVAISHAFGSSQSSAKDAVTPGIADSKPCLREGCGKRGRALTCLGRTTSHRSRILHGLSEQLGNVVEVESAEEPVQLRKLALREGGITPTDRLRKVTGERERLREVLENAELNGTLTRPWFRCPHDMSGDEPTPGI